MEGSDLFHMSHCPSSLDAIRHQSPLLSERRIKNYEHNNFVYQTSLVSYILCAGHCHLLGKLLYPVWPLPLPLWIHSRSAHRGECHWRKDRIERFSEPLPAMECWSQMVRCGVVCPGFHRPVRSCNKRSAGRAHANRGSTRSLVWPPLNVSCGHH